MSFGGSLTKAGPRLASSGGSDIRHYILSIDGIFFWQRVLFGLAGPAVLSYLTWETAKIQSTQSATGILYVDFFTVVVDVLWISASASVVAVCATAVESTVDFTV